MAETSYLRTFTTTCISDLISTINDDVNIAPIIIQIVQDESNSSQTVFWFDNALTTAEESVFDNILSTWSCPQGDVPVGEELIHNAIVHVFNREKLKKRTWMAIGGTESNTAGYVMPYNARIIAASYHVGRGDPNYLELYINGNLWGDILYIDVGDDSVTNMGIDLNFNDRIQLRARERETEDVVVSLYIIWK